MSVKRLSMGFTLIEVMLAMTLLSIIVLLLFSSLKIAAESWDKGEAKIVEVNEKAVVYHFFKRHIPTIRPLWDDFSEDDRVFSFIGTEDRMRFVSTFPASASRKGMQLFEIYFEPIESGVIKVDIRPFYPAIDEQSWEIEEEVLIRNVESFDISYFTREDNDTVGSWENSWENREILPGLIKIQITLLDNSYWPEMVFPIKLAQMDSLLEEDAFDEAESASEAENLDQKELPDE